MTDIYGAAITDGKVSGELFPVFVSFWNPKASDDVTGIHFALTDEEIGMSDPRFIASLMIDHPAGVKIDQDNWAGFLHLQLMGEPKSTRTLRTSSLIKRKGFSSFGTRPSFGYYFFDVESNHGRLGIIIDRPKGTVRPIRKIPHTLTINNDNPVKERLDGVHYNDEKIVVTYGGLVNLSSSSFNDPTIAFKKRLDPIQVMKIYVEGIESFTFSEDLFDNSAAALPSEEIEASRSIQHSLKHKLVFRSIGDFHYLASPVSSLVATLQKEPAREALKALDTILRTRKDSQMFSGRDWYQVLQETFSVTWKKLLDAPLTDDDTRSIVMHIVANYQNLSGVTDLLKVPTLSDQRHPSFRNVMQIMKGDDLSKIKSSKEYSAADLVLYEGFVLKNRYGETCPNSTMTALNYLNKQ